MLALKLLLLLALTTFAQTLLYRSLTSATRMRDGDELVSTLGQYKAVLAGSDCSLNFYRFGEAGQSYLSLGSKYRGSVQGSCQWLTIVNGSVVTDATAAFLALASPNLTRVYLIIDDLGSLRLIGLKPPLLGLSPADF
jgi:hypothetical protein